MTPRNLLICISRITSSMMCLFRSSILPNKDLDQPAICLQQNSPADAGVKVSL